jgi:hypothetical protein
MVFLVICSALSGWTPAAAQILSRLMNPQVEVTINHPPSLGLLIDKVAFRTNGAGCPEELEAALVDQFVTRGTEVVDRANLESILRELDFGQSGYVDANRAATIGQMLGPAVLVFLKVTRCAEEQQALTNHQRNYKGEMRYEFISRTTAHLKGSVQAVDLATGKIFAARSFDQQLPLTYSSESCCPEFPSTFQARDAVLALATTEILRMFFPWTERRELVFFDSKDCNLKTAHAAFKAGDLESSWELSQENLETCKSWAKAKPSDLAHAYYNLGMVAFVRGEYDVAEEHFRLSMRTKPSEVATEALAECRRARELELGFASVVQWESGGPAGDSSTVPAVSAGVGSGASKSNGAAQSVPPAPQPVQSTATAPSGDPATARKRLEELKALLDQGLITKEEFEQKRAEILRTL